MVTKFFAHKHSGYMYDGYEIKVTGDPRDINEDRFQLEVIGSKEGTNKFLYTKPAVPASLWLDEPANDDDASEEIQTGNQISIQRYRDLDEDLKKRKYEISMVASENDSSKRMKLTDKPFLAPEDDADTKKVKSYVNMSFFDTGI